MFSSARRSAGEGRRSRAQGPRVIVQAPEGCGTGRLGPGETVSWEAMLTRTQRSFRGSNSLGRYGSLLLSRSKMPSNFNKYEYWRRTGWPRTARVSTKPKSSVSPLSWFGTPLPRKTLRLTGAGAFCPWKVLSITSRKRTRRGQGNRPNPNSRSGTSSASGRERARKLRCSAVSRASASCRIGAS